LKNHIQIRFKYNILIGNKLDFILRHPDGRNPLDSGLWKLRLALPAPPRDTKRAANGPRAVI